MRGPRRHGRRRGSRRRTWGKPRRRHAERRDTRRLLVPCFRCGSSSPAAAGSSARISSSGSRPTGATSFVARSADYDLRRWRHRRLSTKPTPDLVFHLAARSAASARTARTRAASFANIDDGRQRHRGGPARRDAEVVIVGTVCAYPKFAPVPFSEDDLWNGYPEETNAPYGIAKKALLVGAQAYREQYGSNSIFLLPGEPVRAARQLRPRDVARDPSAHPQVGRGCGATEVDALGRRLADARVPLRRRRVEGIVLAAERYDGPDPVNLGAGARSRSATSPS